MAGSKICIVCGEEKRSNQLLKHKNLLLNDKFSICRDCANSVADFSDEESVIEMEQLANIPFVKNLYIDVKRQSKKPSFGIYQKKLAPYKKFETFSDSAFTTDGASETVDITPELERRWGKDYSEEEYAYFENALQGLIAIKPATTAFEIQRYVANVKLKNALDEAFKDGNSKDITALRKAYSEDSKDLGFDAVLSGNDDSGKSLGQRIQNWELNEPVPDSDKYEDTAGLKKYINKWFVIPMKRTFGVASEKEVDSLYED